MSPMLFPDLLPLVGTLCIGRFENVPDLGDFQVIQPRKKCIRCKKSKCRDAYSDAQWKHGKKCRSCASIKRHKVCPDAKKGLVCTRGHTCDGAHCREEFEPPPCRDGDGCRKVYWKEGILFGDCNFKHPGEGYLEYFSRTGRKVPFQN